MNDSYNFDSIRPYNDNEVKKALTNLLEQDLFIQSINKIAPQWNKELIISYFNKATTIKEFQKEVIYPVAKSIIRDSITELSFSGIGNIEKDKTYLFISNHRDIVLDSALLNVVLLENGFETFEIAIGSNLLTIPWVKDIVRLNKSFVVNRNVQPQELYNYSQLLSAYIRHTILEKKVSIWIAQREGRAKDGNDQTQSSVLKMLALNAGCNAIDHFKTLNVVPISISYEFDPCDINKAIELDIKCQGLSYEKAPNEDFKSMIRGIIGQKGRVHIAIGKVIDEELSELTSVNNKNEQIRILADIINRQIFKNYKLWPNNYIALNLLDNSADSSKFNTEEKTSFVNYVETKLDKLEGNRESVRQLLHQMYANPVINVENIINTH